MQTLDFHEIVASWRRLPKAAAGDEEPRPLVQLVTAIRALNPPQRHFRYARLAAELSKLAKEYKTTIAQGEDGSVKLGRWLDEVRRGNMPRFAAMLLNHLWDTDYPTAKGLIRAGRDKPYQPIRLPGETTLEIAQPPEPAAEEVGAELEGETHPAHGMSDKQIKEFYLDQSRSAGWGLWELWEPGGALAALIDQLIKDGRLDVMMRLAKLPPTQETTPRDVFPKFDDHFLFGRYLYNHHPKFVRWHKALPICRQLATDHTRIGSYLEELMASLVNERWHDPFSLEDYDQSYRR